MKNIFLVPRSSEVAYKNYMSSMQGKPIDDFAPYLNEEELAFLKGQDKYFVWGCQPSLKSRWENMQVGDYILFYAHGRFISVGQIKYKKFSEDLALSLWSRSKDSGESWSCVFFIENLHDIDLSLEKLNSITGYRLRALQGLMQVVKPDAIEGIRNKYGSIEGFIESLIVGLSDDDVNEIISISLLNSSEVTGEDKSRLDELTRGRSSEDIEKVIRRFAKEQLGKKPEQIEKMTKSYRRNRALVEAVKTKYENKCQICGFTFMTSSGRYYSEAAHIVPLGGGKNGDDSPDNIWILCPNHHKMLDHGAIEALDNCHYRLGDRTFKLKYE